ncbi:MAG: hypothetical protein ACREIR_10735 [Geminicoccaceae bacterium]
MTDALAHAQRQLVDDARLMKVGRRLVDRRHRIRLNALFLLGRWDRGLLEGYSGARSA